MTGFSNPIIGGGGALVYPSIHSPNFELGPPVTGWSIDKNGNAYLGNVILSGTFSGNYYELTTAGFFIYSGPPAAGNLIISIASAPGSDGFGNGYQGPGVYVYAAGSATTYAGLSDAILTLANAAGGGVWNLLASSLTPDLVISSGGGGQLYIAQLSAAAANIVGGQLNAVNTPEAWHTISLNAGFAALAGFAAPRYRYEPIGSGGQVRLDGALSLTANQAVGTAFATMPATYRPAFSHYYLTGNSLAGGVGSEVESVRVINSAGGGFLELGSNGNNGNYVLLEGITYVLD